MKDTKFSIYEDFEKAKGMTYEEAKEYLKSIGKWERNKDYDGYSIIETACYHKNLNMEGCHGKNVT